MMKQWQWYESIRIKHLLAFYSFIVVVVVSFFAVVVFFLLQ